jgi:hypothetical protein
VTLRSGSDEEAQAHLHEGGLGNWIRSSPLPRRPAPQPPKALRHGISQNNRPCHACSMRLMLAVIKSLFANWIRRTSSRHFNSIELSHPLRAVRIHPVTAWETRIGAKPRSPPFRPERPFLG